MQKWEYKVGAETSGVYMRDPAIYEGEARYIVDTTRYRHQSELFEALGNEGWELVSVLQNPKRDFIYEWYYFKRPKE